MNRSLKKVFVPFVLLNYAIVTLFAQENSNKISLTADQVHILKSNEKVMRKWVESLTTPGVKLNGDSLEFSPEVIKMMNDSAYRKSIFVEPYTFVQVGKSLSNMEIQKAFWQMLNLYPENKERVIKYIYAYNSVLDASKLLFSSFYTYAFLDPRISTFKEQQIEIIKPDLLEELHKNVLEIIAYISYLEKSKEKKGVD